MAKKRTATGPAPVRSDSSTYDAVLASVTALLEAARHAAARSVNSVITTTYWEIGRRIVEEEQRGHERAAYGARLIDRLSDDLIQRFGRGFSRVNLKQMRRFYLEWSAPKIGQTASAEFAGVVPLPSASVHPLFSALLVPLCQVALGGEAPGPPLLRGRSLARRMDRPPA